MRRLKGASGGPSPMPINDKHPIGLGGRPPRPAVIAMSIIVLALASYVVSIAGDGRGWPEVLELSVWLALPAAIAAWGVATRRKPVPRVPCPARLATVLARPDFIRQLRLERLRSDRSGTPLSIFLFSIEEEKQGKTLGPGVESFLERLRAGIRETDIFGHVEDDRFGLLLTDTDTHGREAYLRKLLSGQDSIPVSMSRGTYPDRVFETLMAENGDSAQTRLIFPDVAAKPAGFGYRLKRSVDVAGALTGIILFSPVLLFTAIAVKLTSPGPVFFTQARLGRNGVPFVLYKFRSMVCDADDRIHREYVVSLIAGKAAEIDQGGPEAPMYKLRADPRVTRVGRIIRKMSIDELPQFFNVLKGDMSLVGPRPPLPYEVEKYQPWHFRRVFEAKPGITGLWQVEGRSRTSFDDMVRLDLEYARSCSLALDLKILCRTVGVVVQGIGAA